MQRNTEQRYVEQRYTGRRYARLTRSSGMVSSRALFALSLSCFAVLILLAFAQTTTAVALGVNRASLQFTDVLRDGYAEDFVVISTDSEDTIGAEVNVTGEVRDWFEFSNRTFEFTTSQPFRLKVMVQPPLDTQPGVYDADITITTTPISRTGEGRLGTSTRASFRIPARIIVTGTERVACTVGGIQVLDTERGQPIELRVSILNRGNVRINPNITIEVRDAVRSTLAGTRTVEFGERILPTVTSEASKNVPFDLVPAQYWATVKVPECDYSSLFTFDVLEPGGIKDDGEFIRIQAPAWADVGDIVPVDALFRNRGVRGVRATFKGTIARVDDGSIAKVISTDEVTVSPGQTAELQTFFNPTVGGQYIVSGKVFYNSKLTLERNTIINVRGPGESVGGISKTTIYSLIGLVIVVLVLLILIRRRRQRAREY